MYLGVVSLVLLLTFSLRLGQDRALRPTPTWVWASSATQNSSLAISFMEYALNMMSIKSRVLASEEEQKC